MAVCCQPEQMARLRLLDDPRCGIKIKQEEACQLPSNFLFVDKWQINNIGHNRDLRDSPQERNSNPRIPTIHPW